LVGEQDPIKMPMGEARITRKNWEDLRTWIVEGAKFDGTSPSALLRDMVPSAGDTRAGELANLSAAEFTALRRERTKTQWQKTFPKAQPATIEGDDFVIYGDVAEQRLQQVAGWAREHARVVQELLGGGSEDATLFKGGLAIFVIRDRFGFNEFHIELLGRPAPGEVSGFARVTAGQEDAQVVLLDLGDQSTRESPGLRQTLVGSITEAALRGGDGHPPDWLMLGTGAALAAEVDPRNAYYRGLREQGDAAVAALAMPEDIYTGRGLTPEQAPAAGYAFVDFLMRTGGKKKFVEFVRTVDGGVEVEQAAANVYGIDSKVIAQRFVASRRSK
jgi:hypothetical protein